MGSKNSVPSTRPLNDNTLRQNGAHRKEAKEEVVQGQGQGQGPARCHPRQDPSDKLNKDVQSYRLVTVAVLVDRMKINGSLARKCIADLEEGHHPPDRHPQQDEDLHPCRCCLSQWLHELGIGIWRRGGLLDKRPARSSDGVRRKSL